jgi:hypothetical protein
MFGHAETAKVLIAARCDVNEKDVSAAESSLIT